MLGLVARDLGQTKDRCAGIRSRAKTAMGLGTREIFANCTSYPVPDLLAGPLKRWGNFEEMSAGECGSLESAAETQQGPNMET